MRKPREYTYRVTGVFIHDPWTPEPITRDVKGPYPEWAISVVDCEALEKGLLFLSAKATKL